MSRSKPTNDLITTVTNMKFLLLLVILLAGCQKSKIPLREKSSRWAVFSL